jgi:hypothetical protein
VKRATACNSQRLSPVSRAPFVLWIINLGLAPQALCCRPLRGLRDFVCKANCAVSELIEHGICPTFNLTAQNHRIKCLNLLDAVH